MRRRSGVGIVIGIESRWLLTNRWRKIAIALSVPSQKNSKLPRPRTIPSTNLIDYDRQHAPFQPFRAAQGGPLLSRLRHVFLHHRRPLRARGHGHDLGPWNDADLSAGAAVFLVHPGVAGFGGVDHRHAGRRAASIAGRAPPSATSGDFSPDGGTGPRRFCWAGLCRAVHRLPGLLLSEDDMVATLPHLGSVDRRADMDQRAGHPDGGAGRDRAGDFHFYTGDDHDRPRAPPLAPQSIYALGGCRIRRRSKCSA